MDLTHGSSIALAAAFALFVWWFSTGLILILVRRRRSTYAPAMVVLTLLTGLAFVGVSATRDIVTPSSAYAGFCYGLVIWAWHETSFLFGYVTGPRTTDSPQAASRFLRFWHALETILHHEIAILATGIALFLMTAEAANQVAAWTYAILWGMRISAKLNVYFGAPNLTDEFLPNHLNYLKTYFGRKRMSALLPVSVVVASVLLAVIAFEAMHARDAFMAVALTLIGTLLALAIIEHLFLVLPIPDAALWRWALRRADPESYQSAALRAPGLAPGFHAGVGPGLAQARNLSHEQNQIVPATGRYSAGGSNPVPPLPHVNPAQPAVVPVHNTLGRSS
jgi:putative photosynthetic complex assembly protein 2